MSAIDKYMGRKSPRPGLKKTDKKVERKQKKSGKKKGFGG